MGWGTLRVGGAPRAGGARAGYFAAPEYSDPRDDREEEAAAFALLAQTGLPLNPERFVRIIDRIEGDTRVVDFGAYITKDEGEAARRGAWPEKRPMFKELQWMGVGAAAQLTGRCVSSSRPSRRFGG